MADLDLDELERLSQARPTDGPAVLEYLAALYLSAPALIAAARELDRLRAAVDGVLADVARWREHTEARTRGGQHVGTGGEIGNLSHSTAAYLERTLGRHVGGESREVDRLRALCRETHAALDGVVDVLGVMGCSCECEHDQGEGHDETCWRCEICRVYSLLVTSCLLDRLRAAGGGT